jgi:hypothetical protein
VNVRAALSAPRLGRRVSDNPLLYLGGAVAAGYLIGGGLGTRLGSRLLRLGGVLAWRFIVAPRLEETVRSVLHGRINDGEG